ncbi:molybdopterin cofactor-binding domain-containing protein [Phenylobacterium sp. VNQ135]|uniref:molybdopterin cofactor-binding domain-containing protein n=1 Tax=Phenylobacterium sp. VNQ135 TaxID=3400922 RepID=UPI003C0F4C3C
MEFKMEFKEPIGDTAIDRRPDGSVGKPLDRVEGALKVTGRAPYAAEHAGFGEVAYGYPVPATIAKGRVADIDTNDAERQPGVLTVLTWRNVDPPNGQAPRTPDGPTSGKKAVPELNDARVDHYGQAVALVVAESFEQARSAARLVRVTYDRELHETELRPNMSKGVAPPDDPEADSLVGDFEGAFAKAPVQLDLEYATPIQSHAMMEPHATIAEWTDARLTLKTSHQMVAPGAGSVAATFRLPKDKVRMISPYIGGGFGGKLDVWADAILAALASHKLKGRPVKVVLPRTHMFEMTGHRPSTIQRIRLGADETGRLQAIAHDVWSENNPDETFNEPAAQQTRNLYDATDRRTTHQLVTLDVPIGCSMRAPGEAVGMMALECAMDELAERLGLDPVELRKRNEPAEDPEKHVPFSTRSLIPCLEEGARRFGWARRNPKPGQVREGRQLIGIGMAAASRSVVLQPSKCRLTLHPDGHAAADLAMTDIGTGTYTILTQVGADLLGLPPEKVTVRLGDTDYPEAAGSGGSFGANSSGSALYAATEALRLELAKRAGVDPEQARLEGGALVAGNVSRSFEELASGGPIEVIGDFKPGDLTDRYSQQSYGAHFCEVAVDMDTGEVRVRRFLSVHAAGRILNEKTARSQCLGGVTMGIGAALTEEVVLDPRFGSYVNHDLAEYHVPAHADIPEMEVVFLPELDDKASPLKAKGLGELGICGVGAAVANAVYNACGVRIRDYPLTLDKVLAGLARLQAS